ncbi:uncharacterized protein SPAPADRAFT_60447 [Spathaspora passalidarum NRRL Y-27907]|uniref:MHD domain-containing protein n=1 Tax=Spathaspora passalidarum (strain NRRL Y-27907 / 11-Y1) TaxID=619300 RepID=G3AL96_SPAPN|nr:uncharacterized protein SPAPADRAFT_60447 [Spathaspora passalidarum NRRL Y-27907]EGW33139.1 hypothetical protein SPAPADRAFT_60447 [Spathaspora passalidarum NRRL Y-27907]
MISAIFLYDSKGDILISKLFKDDVKRTISDVFRIQVITQTRSRDSSTKSPVLTLGSTSFIYIKSGSVWICAVTRSNQDCASILEYLYKLELLLRSVTMDKRGSADVLTDEAIINNFNLVYEIIDESCDFGFPTNLDLSYLKNFISCLNDSDKVFKMMRKPTLKNPELSRTSSSLIPSNSAGSPPPLASNITWRSQGLKYRRNEIYLNVTEKVNVLMNQQSEILRSYVDGSIQMKTHLSGMPSCKFGFNANTVLVNYKPNSGDDYGQDRGFVVLEDSKFHQCVDLRTFENDRVIQFTPPDGEFQLMSYNCHSSINLPFRIYPQVQEIGRNRLMYKIVIKSFFPVKLPATNVVVKIPTPKTVTSKLIQHSTGKAKYHPEEHVILWKFNKFFGSQEQVLTAEVELSGESDELLYWARPPITLDFVLDMFSCSGLTVKFLRVQEKSNYKTLKWVKYTSQAGSYEVRY